MDVEEVWGQVQPVIASAPVLAVLLALFIFGMVKKIIKLAVTMGILVAVWVLLQTLGVTPAV